MRILLVEDEKNLSAAVCRLLSQERFVVDPAYTGPDGLDCALSGGYDAIILDVMLPGMDGFTILDRLRAEGVKTPVMMLTARGDLQDRIRGLEGGADYYLPKPFQMGDAEYNNLEVYVSFLRKKLSFIGAGVKLKATRGLGYSLEEVEA